jgi:hypothetical protein
MPHDKLVFGGAASVGTGFDNERTGVSKSTFPAANGVLDEDARCQVTVIHARR